MLHVLFKLGQCVKQRWRKLRGFAYRAKIVGDLKFVAGEETGQPDYAAP